MRVRRFALLVVTGAAVVASCGGSREPSADERRVCSVVQKIVDAPADGDGESALASLPELEQAVNATGNERMSNAGTAFFDELSTDIDYTQLTLPETQELGRYYMEVLAEHLAEIVNACDEAGAAIEGV
jgi:hypothetical protein